MAYDTHSNFAISTIATPPSPAVSGNTIVLNAGDGALFATNQNVTVWPANVNPTKLNAEIIRITAKTGDTLTISRAQEGSTAQSIASGWQIANAPSAKWFTDLETGKVEKSGDNMSGQLGLPNVALVEGTIPNFEAGKGKIYVKSDHKLYFMDASGVEYNLITGNPTTQTATPSGQTTQTSVGTPPAPASADPVNWTRGPLVFQSAPPSLADFNSDSPVTVGGETVTVNATAGPTGGPAFVYATLNSASSEVGLHKDLSAKLVRNFQFPFKLNSAATINGEFTIFHAWTDKYGADLVEIRITNSGSGFNFLLRAPGDANTQFSATVPGDFKRSNNVYAKNVWYDVELYMSDVSFSLLVGPAGGTRKPIIDWFAYTSYAPVNNTGKSIGGITLGKFYSTQLNGTFYIGAPAWYQDYVAPTGPTTASGQLNDVWAGIKARYVRSDGAVVRPVGDGQNGAYQNGSDVVSESVAYAMLSAVQMNDQTAFDLIYTWTKANLQRFNNGSLSTGTHLMAWHYDDVNNAVYDWNWATDAEMDVALALIWAHHRWTSAGTVHYNTEATAITTDLKTYAFKTISGKAYLCSDAFQGSASNIEINPSYMSVAAMKVIRDFTGDAFWDTAISGTYDLLNKCIAATLLDQGPGQSYQNMTAAGIPPDWIGLDSSTAAVGNPPNQRKTTYSYDAVRVPLRVYWHYLWYADSNALSFLTGALRTFYVNEWTTLNTIKAEHLHNGTVSGNYEKSMIIGFAYVTLLAQSPSDATAAAIKSAKLSNMYGKYYPGAFWKDNNTPQGAPSYYNNFLMMFIMLILNNSLVNY